MTDLSLAFLAGFAIAASAAALASLWVFRRFQRLHQRTQRAEQLAEMVKLTGGLAHEIKNPLSTIQLNLQLLHEDLPGESVVGSRVHPRLKTIRQEVARLREILDDFLRYAGRMTLEIEEVDLNSLVEQVGDFFMPQAMMNKVQLRMALSPGPLMARVDPRLIKQALLNLMLNATQAMPKGGELIVNTRRVGPSAQIEVIDTGHGIAPEAASQIFQAYYTTKKSGTGLGLPMTRRIAEEHDGTISLQSEIEKGSIFTIKLPISGPKTK